uniref:BACK domain-containing protein n=1 Tax=Angiostrongylus cantonensis TaxID=6313 RepID=A0A158PBX1_ANGCA
MMFVHVIGEEGYDQKRRPAMENGKKTIKLVYKKGHRHVKIADFAAVSELIKQHQITGRVPRSVDLTDYFDATIMVFADYIEKGEVKAQISFYALAELLKLTKTFIMEDLQKRLEEILILTAESSTNHLLQAVLVAGTSNITKETENALHYLASWSFVEMARLPDFQCIPYHQFVMLLASCELQVSHELVVADAALLWLVGQPHPAVYAPGVFAVIRSAFLTKADRQLIIERIATLQMPESVGRFARVSMDSRHNARVCLEGTHISRHLCRCGIPNPEKRPKETTLPLSRPREGIKWSEKTHNQTMRSRPEKVEDAGKWMKGLVELARVPGAEVRKDTTAILTQFGERSAIKAPRRMTRADDAGSAVLEGKSQGGQSHYLGY